jgi:hypothetical protein
MERHGTIESTTGGCEGNFFVHCCTFLHSNTPGNIFCSRTN